MINYINTINKVNNFRIFVFIIIIIQSIGIRFFEGQGTVLAIIILIISIKNLNILKNKDLFFFITIFVFLLFNKLINKQFSFKNLIFLLLLITSTYLFILKYRKLPELITIELFIALKILILHSVIGYFIYLILPTSFSDFNVMNKSFLNFFFISKSYFIGLNRNTGLFWEPGVYQLAANLYLFFCIKFDKKILQILIAALAVISSFSTIGLIIILFNAYYFISKRTNFKILVILKYIPFIILLFYLFYPIFKTNITNKINDTNTSSLTRYRDLIIGIDLIKEKPFFGHGIFNIEYLLSNHKILQNESNIFSSTYINAAGQMSGGYTNGLLGLIIWFGLPASSIIYLFFLKNKFVYGENFIEKSIFNLIVILSLVSSPITYTSFFLILPFSYLIIEKKYISIN